MARLIVIEGADLGNEYELEEFTDGSIVIGRDSRATITLNDNAVSREHCRLESSLAGLRVVDLGSRNHTYVNGDPVRESVLRDGDTLSLGDTEVRYEDEASPVETNPAASTIIKELSANGSSRDWTKLTAAVRTGSTSIEKPPTTDPGKTAEQDLRHALKKAERLFDLSWQCVGPGSIRELFDKLLAVLVPAVGGDHGAFLVREGDRWVAQGRYDRAGTTGGKRPTAFNASLSIVERVAAESKAILSATDTDRSFGEKASVAEEQILSAMAAAVSVKGAVEGVIYVDSRRPDSPLSDAALELLRSLVQPAGRALERLKEESRLLSENRNLRRSILETRRIIGKSAAIGEVLEFISRAAPTSMTILIEGETGTGKELVASAIHYSSPRRGGPFVALNCAALPENLVESELFGHERGAFTGAVSRRKGRFELAAGGTVFLDEVGELSLGCQAKLLRLLEAKRFERVGGSEAVQVDVRIVAATNKDLREAVAKGDFREDLYYRLGVLCVKLKPLRERTDDVPLLVEHFLKNLSTGGRPKKLSKDALKRLCEYPWPGNVRQLRNVVESSVVLSPVDEIRPQDLVMPPPTGGSVGGSWEPISLQELEKRHILRVLEHTRGNKKRAAEILGIERCTLYSKLKNYDA